MRWFGLILGLIAESSCFSVRVVGPHYARHGSSVQLTCDHGVPPDLLHKVDWLKGGLKFFQYVKGRKPPFRNFSLNGAIIDWESSSDRTVMLRKLGLAASGHYSCEVATDTPIFTKASDTHELVVIQNQMEEPRISFGRPVYYVGDVVRANCTSGRATPTPSVTWLVNDKQVSPELVKIHRTSGSSGRAELRLRLLESHVPRVRLTCLSTIPGYPTDKYADRRANSMIVEVVPAAGIKGEVQKSLKSSGSGSRGLSILAFLVLCASLSP